MAAVPHVDWTKEKKTLHQNDDWFERLYSLHERDAEGGYQSMTACISMEDVKRVLKSKNDVTMVLNEAKKILPRATEMFAQELALRAFIHAKQEDRKQIMLKDFTATLVDNYDIYQFLVDLYVKVDLDDKP
ncbi:hypothetical protein PIB30_089593 [Stylosanthes scabra]|uniref:Transcription factor CBF/NF-Y/archaeal histone domain-containing protein n=1 Tax=Stylosanthes scabra TaxID=79078 RepID=A0ABU6YRL3_9FABA|nr:hypothetical protein [Stylosanthes scabra]